MTRRWKWGEKERGKKDGARGRLGTRRKEEGEGAGNRARVSPRGGGGAGSGRARTSPRAAAARLPPGFPGASVPSQPQVPSRPRPRPHPTPGEPETRLVSWFQERPELGLLGLPGSCWCSSQAEGRPAGPCHPLSRASGALIFVPLTANPKESGEPFIIGSVSPRRKLRPGAARGLARPSGALGPLFPPRPGRDSAASPGRSAARSEDPAEPGAGRPPPRARRGRGAADPERPARRSG